MTNSEEIESLSQRIAATRERISKDEEGNLQRLESAYQMAQAKKDEFYYRILYRELQKRTEKIFCFPAKKEYVVFFFVKSSMRLYRYVFNITIQKGASSSRPSHINTEKQAALYIGDILKTWQNEEKRNVKVSHEMKAAFKLVNSLGKETARDIIIPIILDCQFKNMTEYLVTAQEFGIL